MTSRKPLVDDENSGSAIHEKSRVDSISFSPAFPESILPVDKRSFRPDEVKLYVHERGWDIAPLSVVEPPGKKTYEEQLDDLFWFGDSMPNPETPRLIFLEGYVGSGKSTLIQYYLRCHCPHVGLHPAKFSEKLIINIDFRGADSAEDFDHTLFFEAKRKIISECKVLGFDIETADGYWMWNPKLGFEGEVFRDATKDINDITSYRAKLVAELKSRTSERDWVDLALTYLSLRVKATSKKNVTFKYIVFCLDNLDQSGDDVIRHAVQRVRGWLNGRRNDIDVWRVFIPVWPTTLGYIVEELGPLPPYEVLQVLAPNTEKVFQVRTAALEEFYGANPAANTSIEFVRNCRALAKRPFHHFLAQLSAGSARSLLEMWRTILSSETLYKRFAKRYEDPAQSLLLGRYYLMDALLTGSYGLHSNSRNPLLNLFTLGVSGMPFRDSLIGPHALAMLRSGMVSSRKDLENILFDLGYTRDSARQVVRRFRKAQMFYDVSRSKDHIYILTNVIDAYNSLLEEKAYVDNVARSTPMDADLRKLVPTATTADPRVSFFERAMAALSLVVQLRRDELEFVADGRRRFGAIRFSELLRERDLGSAYRRMADHYLADLMNVRTRGLLSDVVQDDQWNKLLGHEAVSGREQWPSSLWQWQG